MPAIATSFIRKALLDPLNLLFLFVAVPLAALTGLAGFLVVGIVEVVYLCVVAALRMKSKSGDYPSAEFYSMTGAEYDTRSPRSTDPHTPAALVDNTGATAQSVGISGKHDASPGRVPEYVSAPDSSVQIACPGCNHPLRIPRAYMTTSGHCNHCGIAFVPADHVKPIGRARASASTAAPAGKENVHPQPNAARIEEHSIIGDVEAMVALAIPVACHLVALGLTLSIIFSWDLGHANIIRTYMKNTAEARAAGRTPCQKCGRPSVPLTYYGAFGSKGRTLSYWCRACAPGVVDAPTKGQFLGLERFPIRVAISIVPAAIVLAILVIPVLLLAYGALKAGDLPELKSIEIKEKATTEPVGATALVTVALGFIVLYSMLLLVLVLPLAWAGFPLWRQISPASYQYWMP